MAAPLLFFPQLVFPRLRRSLQRLALSVWGDPQPLEVARTAARHGGFPFSAAQKEKLVPVSVPCAWQAEGFSTSWFRLRLPRDYRLRPGDHVHWDDNAEATAWSRGEPLFGLDATHRYWPWPQGETELWLESIFCQSGIWHAAAKGIGPLGSQLTQARLVRKNEENWQAYFDLEVLTDWLEEEIRRTLPFEAESLLAGFRSWPEMDSASSSFLPDGVGTGIANRHRPELDRLPALIRRVLRELDEAITVYYLHGAEPLRKRLAKIFGLLRESSHSVRATLTGHAHIDLVWLWPESTGEQKAVRTFATTERLLKDYPDFVFGYSQPASYEAVQRRAPGLMNRVMRHVRSGQWEPVGAMYVESDTLLACGEALLRSLTLGQKGFCKLTRKPSEVLWLPDAFGFSGCLPALMQLAGVSFFYTNKLMWSMIHRFPHSSFVWRGSDGSEVTAHVSRACGYNNPARPRNLRLELDAHRQSDVHAEMLLPSGWGDGGGGPTADIIERVKRQSSLRNQPAVQWGRIDAFFDRLEKCRDRLPVHVGEILIEAHRGTYTTHGFMRLAYRRLERALQIWEAARCLAGGDPVPDHSWQRLVFAQFHDFLPGSSIHEVYEEMVPELDRLAGDAVLAAGQDLCGDKNGAGGWFNPLPHPLPVWIGSEKNGKAGVLAPLSVGRPEKGPAENVSVSPRSLRNGRVDARFDKAGNLRDLRVDGCGGLAGFPRLVCYRDIPYDLEAWEIDRQALDAGENLKPAGSSEVGQEKGRAFVRQKLMTRGGSSVILSWILRAGWPVLEAGLDINWREPEMLLRFEMPTIFRGQHALFGAPYGAGWRPQQPGDPRQSALWEVPASRWIMAADEGRTEGAFLLSEAKYGFSIRDGVLGVSLLKSAKVTMTTAFPPAFRAPGPHRPAYSDLGRQRVRLAIGFLRDASSREEHPAALCDTVFAEPLRVSGPVRPSLMPRLEGLPSLVPSWTAPLGKDRWLLRLHETMGRRGTVRVTPPAGWRIRRSQEAFPTKSGSRLSQGIVAVEPFSIVTLEVFQ
jgi:alpha-mannosidase